ncbi:hypothetical protein Z043_109977 [Scleropages formosus]|uniref:Uncharacterized protein n=1 Tax=Scleropages formosus TaxID=113540 RepID=A0A0P7X3A5_SCLFO|nr:hypothetical protein Z043_109977 [Scleropages formosus]
MEIVVAGVAMVETVVGSEVAGGSVEVIVAVSKWGGGQPTRSSRRGRRVSRTGSGEEEDATVKQESLRLDVTESQGLRGHGHLPSSLLSFPGGAAVCSSRGVLLVLVLVLDLPAASVMNTASLLPVLCICALSLRASRGTGFKYKFPALRHVNAEQSAATPPGDPGRASARYR